MTNILLTDMATGERVVVDTLSPIMLQDRGWRTADGTELQIEEMTTSHISNTIAWMRRRPWRLKNKTYFEAAARVDGPLGPSGDMATLAAERELQELLDAKPREWLETTPLVRAMKRELVRRDTGF